MNQALQQELSRNKLKRADKNAIRPPQFSLLARLSLALFVAAAIALASITLMQQLISQRQAIASQDYDVNVIDFVRLKQESEVETRQRTKPKEPEPPTELTPKKVAIAQTQAIIPQDMNFNLPELDLPSNLTGGPKLGGLMSHRSGAAHSSVIPLVRIQPQYPRRAIMRGTEGEVVLAFTITPTGGVKNIEVVSATPKGIFERAAKRALLKWKFKPKVVNGEAVAQQAQQNFVFRLEN